MVTMPRSWILALVAAAVLGLVALGFLLGRRTPPPASPPVAQAPEPEPQASLEPLPYASPEAQTPSPVVQTPSPVIQAPSPVVQTPSPVVQAPSPVVQTPAAPAPDPAERKAVLAYFAAMDPWVERLAAVVNPDTVAQAVVAATAQADPRGLRSILQECQAVMRGVQEIRPPGPCQVHHQKSLRLIESATSLVAQLGAEALTPIQETPYDHSNAALALQRQVQELRALRKEIMERY